MEQEFVLKHRLVGAAVLIFFGVLVLPWWLSPPEPQAETSPTSANEQSVTLPNADTNDSLEDDLLAALAAEQGIVEVDEESVYVSRITPIDERGGASSSSQQQVDQELQQALSESPAATETSEDAVQTTQVAPSATANEDTSNQVDPVATTSTTTRELDTDSSQPNIEVGWAVQVGVYTDASGAQKVIEDLKRNGFDPQSTIVETNRGSGTRIWLGPFEARVDAAKAKNELTEKTGEPGFIRRYP